MPWNSWNRIHPEIRDRPCLDAFGIMEEPRSPSFSTALSVPPVSFDEEKERERKKEERQEERKRQVGLADSCHAATGKPDDVLHCDATDDVYRPSIIPETRTRHHVLCM